MRTLTPLALALALAGCGQPAAPPTAEPPATDPAKAAAITAHAATSAQPQAVGRKTFTRAEIEAWWKERVNGRRVNAEDAKAKFGRPDSTREVMKGGVNGRPGTTYTEYTYNGLSVDADGSGKADANVKFLFLATNDGLIATNWSPEFVP